jgi:restriction system protein
MDKEQEPLKLVRLRQSKVYDGYTAIADYANKAHECDYVYPYSKSAHNVDADVFVILQDWSYSEGIEGDGVCGDNIKYLNISYKSTLIP